MNKAKFPVNRRIRRGRIAKKMLKAGTSLDAIAEMWGVHENTVKWYIMEANHANEKLRRDGSPDWKIG